MLVIAELVDINKFFWQTITSTFFTSKMEVTNLNLGIAAYVPLQKYNIQEYAVIKMEKKVLQPLSLIPWSAVKTYDVRLSLK